MSFQADWFVNKSLVGVIACGLLAGCSGGEDGTETDATTTTTTTTTTSETSETTEVATTEDETTGSETAGPVGACDPDAPIDLEVSEDISEDTVWQGTVRVTDNIDIEDGATLTIMPGTAVVVETDRNIEVGWNSSAATILAEGTADQPIEFCGESPEPGAWAGIDIQKNVTSDSVFNHVIIRHAGNGRPALVLDTGITIANTEVIDSGDIGVEAVDFRDGSENLTVTGSLDVPVLLTGEGAITRLPIGGAYTGNAEDVIVSEVDDIVDGAHYRDPGVPYVQAVSVDVFNEAEVTYDAGVVYRLGVDVDVEFGWNSDAATVMVEGTSESPVVFEGTSPMHGFWRSILIRKNVTSNSRLQHLIVRDGGGDGPAMSIQAAITLDNVSFEDNTEALYIDEQGLDSSSTAVSVTGTLGPAMTLEPNAIVSVPTGGDYTGNDRDEIVVEGGDLTVSGTVFNAGIAYYIAGAIDIYQGAELTIEAGNEFIMGPDTDFEFGWNNGEAMIHAQGTADQPIVFRGRDPVAGWWHGLRINGNVLSNSKLDYVNISHGGQAGGANIFTRIPLDITNSTIQDSEAYGILKESGDMTDYLGPNTFSNNPVGDVGDI